MSNDLIRRIDAMQACQVGPSDEWSRMTKSGYSQAATDCSMGILKCEPITLTLSAAMELPEVRALVEMCKYLTGENADHLRIAIAGNPNVINEMQTSAAALIALFTEAKP
jgi:hypothetical protein